MSGGMDEHTELRLKGRLPRWVVDHHDLEHQVMDRLEARARTAEAAAEEARQRVDEEQDRAAEFRAAAEEARQKWATADKAVETLLGWSESATARIASLESDLAEARQERERFEALALTNAKAADRNAARIQTLEAALREIRDGTWNHAAGKLLTAHEFARAALQPTTDV